MAWVIVLPNEGRRPAWPTAARAQQAKIPVVGFLGGRSPGEAASFVAAFRQGLRDLGWLEGQNLAVEAPGLERAVVDGADSVNDGDAALMG